MGDESFTGAVISRRIDGGANELLTDHAVEVASRMCDHAAGFETEESPSVEPDAIVRCVGLLHDFGKVTPSFQTYIRDEYPPGKPKRYTYHARIGAFAAFHTLRRMGASDRACLSAWGAILRHHGRLPDFADRTLRMAQNELHEDSREAWVGVQIRQIEQEQRSNKVAEHLLTEASGGATSWSAFAESFNDKTLIRDLGSMVGNPRLTKADPANLPEKLYDQLTMVWGALVLADKTAAAELPSTALQPRILEIDALEDYLASIQLGSAEERNEHVAEVLDGSIETVDEDSLNAFREAARQRIRDIAPALAEFEVGTITLPTGLGKTFSGITGAFALRDELRERSPTNRGPIVVYALPYTSIIEQTREHFEDERIFDADPTGREFTVHHYLTDTVTYTDGEDDPRNGKAELDISRSETQLLGESWRSSVILTTFVQLFESLAGPTNAQGLKLSALQNAVIILDEPQAISHSWWGATRRLVRLLVDQYDARIISMTATQPTLFTQGDFETISLLDGEADDESTLESTSFEERAYNAVPRVRYRIDESVGAFSPDEQTSPVTHSDAATRLVEDALSAGSNSLSVLSVCNTIASSRKLTESVVDEFEARGSTVTHIGDTLETVLERLDNDDGRFPDPTHVATEVLRELGCTPSTDDSPTVWNASDRENVAYLGTFNSRYRPLDRRILLRIANTLSTLEVPFVFVSTQAIEAGVDISFARAYRDIGPLDSIVQTAGRCNRSFEWGTEGGIVTIWTLASTDGDSGDVNEDTPPAKYIYSQGGHLRFIAEILLKIDSGAESGSLPATTLEREAVPRYFQEIDNRPFSRDELVEYIDDCNAERLGKESLIGQDYQTVDILVAVTDADRQRIDDLAEAFCRSPGAGFSALDDLIDLRVSVPVRDVEESLTDHIRADHTARSNTEGVDVFVHYGTEANGEYLLNRGGFLSEVDDGLTGRFTLS